jgi:hypothetical protein
MGATLHYITYSTQQGVGTPLGANESNTSTAVSMRVQLASEICRSNMSTVEVSGGSQVDD